MVETVRKKAERMQEFACIGPLLEHSSGRGQPWKASGYVLREGIAW